MNKKIVGDITHGYAMMDEEDVIKHQMLCDQIGKYLGRRTRKEYDKMSGGETNFLKTSVNSRFGLPSTNPFDIKKVIFNTPATIVYWGDGTKTIVKAGKEEFDPEKGLAMAYVKKALGNKGSYFNHIKKWVKAYKPKAEEGTD